MPSTLAGTDQHAQGVATIVVDHWLVSQAIIESTERLLDPPRRTSRAVHGRDSSCGRFPEYAPVR
jgi:hypothetical protein